MARRNIVVGQQAPRFMLRGYSEGLIRLTDYRDKSNVLLVFYKKDGSNGCTQEMCRLSKLVPEFKAHNIEVLAISADDLKTHKQFSEQYHLKQHLLSDNLGRIGRMYGVFQPNEWSERRVMFLIDKKGIVRARKDGMPTEADWQELLAAAS